MKPEHAQRDRKALEIFGRAIELAGAEARAAYLEDACGGDAALKARVEALLANHVEDTFLEKPAAGLGPGGTAIVSITEKAGDRIGRYKLLQQIGEGGCGVVYMAEQEEPVRRRVALKVIKLGMDTRQVVARFEAERQALAIMDHPHIARVFDAGATDTGRPYFVMELVRGIKITEFCDQQKLSTRARLDLFMQVCSAVQHAHQKGIIHRDLKPSNILVTTVDGTPVPKVIDFGIAKATNQQRLTDKTLFTAFEQFIGTPAYMSPEQAEMSGVDIDTRSDIYSLGVVLYELLTGRTPFDAEQLFRSGLDGIRKTLREQEPSKPSTALGTLAQADLATVAHARHTESPRLLHQVSGDLDWVVMKCLEKDRARRYETANGLAQDVLRHLKNEPVAARPPSAAYKFQKAWRRNKLVFSAAAAVSAALVIGLGFSTWAFFKEREARTRALSAEAQQSHEREKAEQARQTATVERDRAAKLLSVSQAGHGVELLEKSDPAGLLYLLEARKSVEHLPEERMRRTLLWSGWMDSLPKYETKILGTANWGKSVGQNSSGPWSATGTTNGEVILWDAETGGQLTSFKTGSQRVWAPELSADGRLLVVNAGGTFQLWDLAPVRSSQPPRRLVGNASRFAFDAKRLRVVTFANEGMPRRGEPTANLPPEIFELKIWESAAEPPLLVTWEGDRGDLANHEFALSPDGSKVAADWKALTLWDAKTGRPIEPSPDTSGLTVARGFFDPLCFSPNGRWLWEVRGSICVRYEVTTGKPVGEPIKGLNRWSRPWVSPNGQHLVLLLESGTQVIQLDTGATLGPAITQKTNVSDHGIALSLDGRRLATTGPDGAVRLWDTKSGQPVGEPFLQPSPATSAVFSPDAQWLTITTQDGSARMHRLAAQASTAIQEWRGTQVLGFNSQSHLLTHTASNRLMQWLDPANGQPLSAGWRIPDRGPVISAAFSPDGRTLVTASQAGKNQAVLRLWDSATGAAQEPSIAWTNAGALAFRPDGMTLAGLSGEYGSIQLWDVASREARALLSLPQRMEVSWIGIHFSPDGKFLATRSGFQSLHVWDVATGRLMGDIAKDVYLAISDDWKLALTDRDLLDISDPRQPRPAPSVINSRGTSAKRSGSALSPDGRLRASSERDNTVRLWDNATGRPVGQEMKTTGTATEMVFSPDSRLLVTSEMNLTRGRIGSGGTLRLWETATGLPCGRPVPRAGMVKDLWFDREVRFLAVTDLNDAPHGAQIWKLPAREISLKEMQRLSWLKAGSRLDEAGNVEILSADEIRQLESEK